MRRRAAAATSRNAAVELAEIDHPARRVIEAIKIEQRDRLADLCRKSAGIAQADLLADTLFVLIEGARVSRQSAGLEGPSAKFVRMCEAVIASFKIKSRAYRADRNGLTELVLKGEGLIAMAEPPAVA